MKLPGFSATASLAPMRLQYARAPVDARRGGAVQPQLIGDIPRCRYVRDCFEVCKPNGTCREKCVLRYVCD